MYLLHLRYEAAKAELSLLGDSAPETVCSCDENMCPEDVSSFETLRGIFNLLLAL